MLCTSCQLNTASTPKGLCDACAQASAAVPPPAPAPQPGPPGAVMVGGKPAWLRSPVVLCRVAVVALGLTIAANLYSLWAGTVMLDVTGDLIAGEFGADLERRAENADKLYGTTGGAQLVTLLAGCVGFLLWFHRVRVNAEVFEPHIHRMKRGWTVGGWFVPVVNFWFPRRIAVDIWDASTLRPAEPERMTPFGPVTDRGSHTLINAWWTLWISSLFAARWATQSYWKAEEAEEIKSAVYNMMFSDGVDIAAAVLAIVVVLRITRMQDLKVRSGPPLAPPVPGPATTA